MKTIHFALITRKTEEMKRFYLDLLGHSISFDDKESGYAEVELPRTAAVDIEPLDVVSGEIGELAKDCKCFLRIEVDDAEAVYQKCLAEKIKVIRKPVTQPYGKKEMYMVDPDGNVVQLYEVLKP